ncbi:YihY/virulence factor BrkB family protein [Devosia soli]|uniref:YihY/virulence factor BrkB family protein n=1 Tax=Devosia soli TaxID=361041 RepID=UPI000A00ABD4|nr:YihY/virulence factor BrkB family protein [Devosia soli]
MRKEHRNDGKKRGRNADGPQDIPPAGWKDIVWRAYREIGDDRVTMIAAAVTYYLLLSLFPMLTAFISIYGLFVDAQTVSDHLNLLSSIVPQGGMDIVNEQLTKLSETGTSTLGVALVISTGLAIWSASSGVKTMFEAMNIAYDEREDRNFFALNAIALAFTFGSIIGAIVLLGAALLVPAALNLMGLGTGLEWLLRIGSYALLTAVLLLGLALLYRFGPSRQQAKWRWISPGALLATVIILILSLLFSWYAANFGNYDKTYGSLGGLIALLTWIWISVTAVIVGAELNSEAERQTRRDSTTGEDAPLGFRDAVVADTVGQSIDDKDEDDPFAGKSAEWIEGYRAASVAARPAKRPNLGFVAAAIPLSLALAAARSRRRS